MESLLDGEKDLTEAIPSNLQNTSGGINA